MIGFDADGGHEFKVRPERLQRREQKPRLPDGRLTVFMIE
jgi:hypothetical protein